MSATTELRPYTGVVKTPDGKLSSPYTDWFLNDEDAKASYRVIMEQQGYEVLSVEIAGGLAIVTIK